MIRILTGDCRTVLPTLTADGTLFDACVTDPPYELGFMGRKWDATGIAFRAETWRLVFETMKPGAYLVAFASTRGYHRMVCAIEDAGFTIHPLLAWVFAQGFPKAHKVEAEGWDGWRYGLQALKPAIEPICLAQKPMEGTGTANVLRHGTGALNIDACRVATDGEPVPVFDTVGGRKFEQSYTQLERRTRQVGTTDQGRWPANVLHDGSDEVEAAFAAFGQSSSNIGKPRGSAMPGNGWGMTHTGAEYADTGSASRFFYCSKADRADRADSRHPTVKPVDLMRWLVRLVTPPGGTVLDCFAGSGTTGEAAMLEGFDATLIEQDAQHAADIRHRIARWSGLDAPLFAEAVP